MMRNPQFITDAIHRSNLAGQLLSLLLFMP